nr:hypothetical protein [uncultured Prevotella sp.]DAE34711.1 MAG TPA: hypothetical protein [Caudoviricetes sp.]
MEEVVNEIMEYIRKKTEDFTYLDQSQIYEEIAGKVSDMNADAMKNEYLNSMDYILDGI